MHRVMIAAVAVALLAAAAPDRATAHAGLVGSDPRAGAALGAAPTVVRLTFSEQPQASLSTIRVLDSRGAAQQSGRPTPLSTDRLTLAVATPRLARGVYTVSYRAVSAVDGHSSEGSFAFGVGVSPKLAAAVETTSSAGVSGLELVARWVLLVGLTLLVGACAAGGPLRLAAGAWLVAAVGLALLAVAQVNDADSSLSDLLGTPVGHALAWRAVAIVAAGVALVVARRRARARRIATVVAGLAALAAIAVHVAAGHAAAGPWSHALTVAAQTTHFAAAGVWIGGLAALLLAVRGAASEEKAAAVRRFSSVALAALVVVAATGTFRAIDELQSLKDLADTGYGRAIVAKVLLLAAIVALGLRQRRRSVPAAATDLGLLRRTSRPELVLAAGALAAAAVLGTLAPPVSGQGNQANGLTASGADFATTVRVKLSTVSPEPGPNRFSAAVEDYDSGKPVPPATRVSLRFTPLDDPGTTPTSLPLRRQRDGTYAGTGPNLAFDGRWGVSADVQTGATQSQVPLELDVPGPPHFVSALRVPGRAPQYTMQIAGLGYIRLTPSPERAGPSTVTVDVFDAFESYLPVSQLVITAAPHGNRARQLPITRLGTARFRAPVMLEKGRSTIDVIAHTREGDVRMRGSFELDVSG